MGDYIIAVIVMSVLLIIGVIMYCHWFVSRLIQDTEIKSMYDMCEYLNENEYVFIRDKNCESLKFRAHVAHNNSSGRCYLIIDLK